MEEANLKQEVQKVVQLLEISHRSPSKTPNPKRPLLKEDILQSSAKRLRKERGATPRLASPSAQAPTPAPESPSDFSMKSESTDDDDDPVLARVAQHGNSGQ